MLKIIIPFLCGYLLKKLKIFKEEDANVLINYVIYFAIPAIAFKSAYNLGISREVINIPILSWLTTFSLIIFSFFIGKLLKLKKEELRLWVLICSWGNTGFLGYPTAYNFFGEEGLNFAIIYDAVGTFPLVLTLGIFIAFGKPDIKSFFKFPPIWALFLGFILQPFSIPQAVEKIINFVAPSVFPVILFAIGMALNLSKLRLYFKKALIVEIIKMWGGAIFCFLIGYFILGMKDVPLKVSVLQASMPTMIFTIILALKYRLNHHLAISCASLGIILSFINTPLVVKLVNTILHFLG